MDTTSSGDYFESYEDLDIHKLMLEDSVRNRAYRKAIFDNVDSFKGKIVLDVGAGSGILSVFCAQAGASKVYAVEASETYKIAEGIAKENGFEHVIKVIHGRVEDVELEEKVDVIVSEWMGFYLLHEGMLDSVIVARDKFLSANGLMFPDSATLYAAPCSVPNMFEDWEDVEGISMKSFAQKLRHQASQKPVTAIIKSDHILAIPEAFCWFDLKEVKVSDLDMITVKHIFVSTKAARYQGISIWFTCTFPSSVTEPVILSTDPDDEPTHWKQTTIVLPEEVAVEEGEPIAVEVNLKRTTESERRYNIEVTMLDPNEIDHPEYCSCYMTKCILAKAVLKKYENNEFDN